MNATVLAKPAGPWAWLWVGGVEEAYDQRLLLARQSPAKLAVRHLEGTRMGMKAGCLAELAAVLQLPPWFGMNWDALLDSLTDLEAEYESGLALIVLHASSLLTSDAELKRFIQTCGAAAERWAEHRPAKALRLVLHAGKTEAKALESRWAKAGQPLELVK